MDVTDDMFAPLQSTHHSVMLDGPVDLAGFRREARRLLSQGVNPQNVSWHFAGEVTPDLFADVQQAPNVEVLAKVSALSATTGAGIGASEAGSHLQVPAGFVELCQSVILHSDPSRFGLLYRLLWRLVSEPGLRHDPLDADRMKAGHLAQAVRRDMHKMKAFVRFRTVQDETFKTQPESGLLHVAWFEPEHHIVEAITPFFVRRFTQMRWAILTPERCVEWAGGSPHTRRSASSLPTEGASSAVGRSGDGLAGVTFRPGVSKAEAPPADAGEQLWLTYYQHIFNPARLKLKAMQKEMPRKYWQNLPEARFISSLSADALRRSATMIDEAPSLPRRRIPLFRAEGAAALRGQASGAVSLTPLRADAAHALDGIPPDSLVALNDAAQRCRRCPIGQHATQAVSGEGPLDAGVMVVGEQPGDQEDLQGRPFVGPAGQLFDRAMADLGQARQSLFITNAVRHFKYEPRGKRRIHKTPSQQEAAACAHWLETEIVLVRPRVALALGATAAASLLGRHVAVMSERGQWFVRPDGLRVLVTLHPAALLRMEPQVRDAAYADWLHDLKLALAVGALDTDPAASEADLQSVATETITPVSTAASVPAANACQNPNALLFE